MTHEKRAATAAESASGLDPQTADSAVPSGKCVIWAASTGESAVLQVPQPPSRLYLLENSFKTAMNSRLVSHLGPPKAD